MAVPTPRPLPMGLGVEIDRAVRLADEGHVLVGGSPPRALRLPPEGVSSVIRWLSGARPDHHRERVLARVLMEAGLAHPRPEPSAPGADVQVVLVGTGGRIDDSALTSTLERIRREHRLVRPVVVGATGAAARTAREHGARLVNGPTEGARARALGLRACDAEFVAFLDIGSEPGPGWLDVALGHFADPDVAAVVPRTLAARQRHGHLGMAIAALRALRADRGVDPAPILPRGHHDHGSQALAWPDACSAEPWEPPRALVVRRGPARLDTSLGTVAEVDLLWSLAAAGRTVRYEPRSRVWVPMNGGLGDYLGARFATGAGAAPLSRRHGGRASGPRVGLCALAALALVVSGRPWSGLAVGAAGVVVDTRALNVGAGVAPVEAVRPALVDLTHTGRLAARAARTTWWPVLAGVAVSGVLAWARGTGEDIAGRNRPFSGLGSQNRRAWGRRTVGGRNRGRRTTGEGMVGRGAWERRARRPGSSGRRAMMAGAVLAVPHLVAWRRRHGAALVDPLSWTALAMAGDAAGALGTWWGVLRTGSVAPLVPVARPSASATSLVPARPKSPRDRRSRAFPRRWARSGR